MKLLIYNDQLKEDIPLEEYEQPLRSKFPQIEIMCSEDRDAVKEFIREADIILTLAIPDELIELANNLKWIQVIIVGINHILSLPSLREDVLITNAQGIHGPQVSEMTFLLMLALARDFPNVILNQKERVWKSWTGKRLQGKRLGIVGVGAIGSEIARKAKTFEMEVYGLDTVDRNLEWLDRFFYPKDLKEMAQDVDYLVLAVPLTGETENMIDEGILSIMKPSSYLINVSRGKVVDHDALVRALRAKRIAGAGLDAYPVEPLPRESELWTLENVIISPHVSGNVEGYAVDVLRIFEENLRRFLSGERRNLINLIDRQKGF